MSGLDQRGHALRLAECILKGDGNVFVQKVICRILMGILLVGSMMLAGGSVSAAEMPQDKLQKAREVLFEFEPSWREREAQGKHSVRLKSGKEVLVTFNITGKWVEEGNQRENGGFSTVTNRIRYRCLESVDVKLTAVSPLNFSLVSLLWIMLI